MNFTKKKISVIITETHELNDARVFRLLNEYPGSEILKSLVVTIIEEKNLEESKPDAFEETKEMQIKRVEYDKNNLYFISQLEKLKYMITEISEKLKSITTHNEK